MAAKRKPAGNPARTSGAKSNTRKKPVTPVRAVRAKAVGGAAPCLPVLEATAVVMGCAGQPFDIDTKLSDVFSDDRREQFCDCVAANSGVPRPFACGAGNTFGDVIRAISC